MLWSSQCIGNGLIMYVLQVRFWVGSLLNVTLMTLALDSCTKNIILSLIKVHKKYQKNIINLLSSTAIAIKNDKQCI